MEGLEPKVAPLTYKQEQSLKSPRHVETNKVMNSPCKHTGWLNFTSAEEPILWDTGRLSRILLELANPTNQRPSLLLFVGRKAKDNALRELFPCNNFQRAKRDGIATLNADTLSLQSPFPIFFAESDPWGWEYFPARGDRPMP